MSEGDRRTEGGKLWQGLRTMLFGREGEPTLREQLEEAIDEADDEARGHDRNGASADTDLSPIERQMIRNLLHFGEMRVDDVAVPRADMIAISASASFAEVVAAFADAGHSRMPVYRADLDDIIGMLHMKDVFEILATDRPPPEDITVLLRQPRYVPQSMGVLDLLAEMRATRTHLAIVIDEYSGTEGLVTIEDLVEEIVGDIEDEHDDEPDRLLVPLGDGLWEADARCELEEIAASVDPSLGETDEDVETVGGLAAMLVGRVPERGDIVTHPGGWRIEVLSADERRVTRVRLHPPSTGGDAGDGGATDR